MTYGFRLAFAALVAASVAAAGCGSGGADLSPVSPTSVASPSSGATITGRVNGGSGLASSTLGASGPMTVSVVGSGQSASVDTVGRFTLTGVPPGSVQLQFTGPGVNATVAVTVAQNEQVQIAVTVNGSGATVESQQHTGSDRKSEIEGRITTLDATARTLRVSGALVAVVPTTVIRHGGTTFQFTDLAVGDQVHVRASMVGDVLTASEIRRQNDGRNGMAEVTGAVSGLTGTCPALTFTVRNTRVTTNGTTFFDDGCADVQNGTTVEVKGVRESGNAIVAVKVEREDGNDDDDDDDDEEDDDQDEAEVQGLVAGLTGTCPSVTFTVGTTRVTTSSSTRFDDSCAQVLNTANVEVKGARQSDGSVLARRVEIDPR
jgi:hypothetical protein